MNFIGPLTAVPPLQNIKILITTTPLKWEIDVQIYTGACIKMEYVGQFTLLSPKKKKTKCSKILEKERFL